MAVSGLFFDFRGAISPAFEKCAASKSPDGGLSDLLFRLLENFGGLERLFYFSQVLPFSVVLDVEE